MQKHVLIAVDRTVLRTGLRTIFLKDADVARIDEVATVEKLHTYLTGSLPDLLIVHQSLATHCRLLPKGRFLLLAFEAKREHIALAYAAGALGYFSENVPEELLLMALRLAPGDFLLDPVFTAQLLECSALDAQLLQSPEGLTERELEVFSLLRVGQTNRAIAHSLHICESTVKTHVAHILHKLDLKRRQAMLLSELKSSR